MSTLPFKECTRKWLNGYDHAEAYFRKFGDLNVHKLYVCEDGYKLGPWIVAQRYARRPGKQTNIGLNQIKMLDAIGMNWGQSFDEAWEHGITELRKYVEEHGTTVIPHDYICEDGFHLSAWVRECRQQLRLSENSKMTEERIRCFEKLGVTPYATTSDDRFENGYRHAVEEVENGVNINAVTKLYVCKDGFHLGEWLYYHKYLNKDGSLDPKRKELMEKLGYRWDKKDRLGRFIADRFTISDED